MKSNHPLRTWRLENGLSGSEFGKQIGVNRSAICAYEYGQRFPRPSILAQIEVATAGAITAAVMLEAYQAAHVGDRSSPMEAPP